MKKRAKTNPVWPALGFIAFMFLPAIMAFAENYQ